MKNLSKFLCVTLLFTAASINADNDCCNTGSSSDCCDNRCVSIYMPRPTGDNLVRQFQHNGYQFGNDCFYGEFSAEFRYQRNFREERVGKSLFGSNCLSFVGSNVADRSNTADIIADNFGLSPLTNVKLGFCPRIQNYIVDLQLYVGLNELWEGLYMQFNAPITHSKWALRAGSCTTSDNNCCDSDCSTSSCSSSDCCDGSSLPALNSTEAFFPGCMDAVAAGTVPAATTLAQALGGDFTFGDMTEKWKYGRFNFCDADDTKLADFYMNIGYNFYECPDYSFGAYLRVVAPTGTDTKDDCAVKNVFYPIIGQDNWRLGGGITAHAELWNCDNEQFINVYLEGYLVHMFDRCQLRSFDFKDKGCMSRYMLLKEFNSDNVYNGNLINAINYTTRNVEVSVDVQGEAAIEFVYSNDCGFSAGLGYNIYGRSEDNICNVGNTCDSTIANRRFGFKGCAPVESQGFQTDATTIPDITETATVVLNSTQSAATIHSCGAVDAAVTLQNTDNPGYIYISTCGTNVANIVNGTTLASLANSIAQDSATGTLAINPANGAITGLTPAPKLITTADLNLQSGAVASQVSHKIFGHLDYAWSDCDWAPYLRAGAEVEFASCDKPGTMNAWGIFVGGGVSF